MCTVSFKERVKNEAIANASLNQSSGRRWRYRDSCIPLPDSYAVDMTDKEAVSGCDCFLGINSRRKSGLDSWIRKLRV